MSIPMTPNGHDLLKKELAYLKKVERPKNVADIAEALSHGDLKENAEYHAAKEKQGFIQGRTQEIQGKLAEANVIDTKNLSTDKVVFGATISLIDIDSDQEKKYTIVGQDEADIKKGLLSVYSPVAKALISHGVGEFIEVKTPSKTVEYEILKISFER